MHQDDVGTTLTFTITDGGSAVDISGATTKTIYVCKPSGTVDTHSAVFYTDGSDGKLVLVLASGDLDEGGEYTVQAKVILASSTYYSKVRRLWVEYNLGEDADEDEVMASAFLNVDNYGAVDYDTDSTADIGEVINDLITDLNAGTKHGIIFIPGRAYGQKTEIVIPAALNSIHIKGVGANYHAGLSSSMMGTASVLVWTGSDGGTMITSKCAFPRIDCISLYGAAKDDPAKYTLSGFDHAAKGLFIRYENGPGTGKFYSTQLGAALCDVGVQFGDGTYTAVADQSRIEHLILDNNTIGVYSYGGQQVGNSIGKIYARNNGTVAQSGGRMSIDSVDMLASNDTLFKVTGSGAINSIANIQMDADTEGCTIIDGESVTGYTVINVDRLHLAATAVWTTPGIRIANQTLLNITNSQSLQYDLMQCTGDTSKRCNIIVTNSTTNSTGDPNNFVKESTSTSPWTLEWSGIRNGNTGERFLDGIVSG